MESMDIVQTRYSSLMNQGNTNTNNNDSSKDSKLLVLQWLMSKPIKRIDIENFKDISFLSEVCVVSVEFEIQKMSIECFVKIPLSLFHKKTKIRTENK